MAIRNSGLIFGTIGLIIIAAICVYCMSLLVHAAHRVCITIRFITKPVVLKLFTKSPILIRWKIQSPKKVEYREKLPENLPKYLLINFQIWFPKSNF